MKRHCITILSFLFAVVAHAQLPHSTNLIKNPSFEEEAKPIRNRRFGPNGEGELFGGNVPAGVILGWILPEGYLDASEMDIVTEGLLDTTQHKALRWTIIKATAATPAMIANVGNQGIEVMEGHRYTLTFWARADKKYKGKIRVGLQSKSDNTWYAQAAVRGKVKKRWKRHSITFTAEGNDPKVRLAMLADKPGAIYLDCVSLTAVNQEFR